jgi:uncharacterized protein
MTIDDLSVPLGQRPAKRRRELAVSVPKVIAAALALFLGVFIVWAIVSDDPFGGEPRVAMPIDKRGLAAANKPEANAPQSTPTAPNLKVVAPDAQQVEPQQSRSTAPPGVKTVTIIDGKTGARQEIVIPAAEAPSPSANSQGAKQ